MLTQLYYADFTQMIYAIHYALYAFITQIIYADFTQIIYAIHYAVYAIHLRRHIYAITIISLRRLRKYRFHYASLRKGQLADAASSPSWTRLLTRRVSLAWCNLGLPRISPGLSLRWDSAAAAYLVPLPVSSAAAAPLPVCLLT